MAAASQEQPQLSQHNPYLTQHPQHTLQNHYDYRPIIHTSPADFAAHLQMPHIPLPLETPLPPSSYDFTSQGAFHMPHSLNGPQAHPLFEGVMAMHQALGHELNFNWSDMSPCSQSNDLGYPQTEQSPYVCEPPVDPQYSQWTPPGSILDSTPSPVEYSQPSTPEQLPEPVIESPISDDYPPSIVHASSQTSSFAIFPLVVSGTKTHEHTIAFQADRPKSDKGTSKLDPHAADFIREKLGDLRWTIFSSRLAERRTTSQKPKKTDVPSATLAGKSMDAFSGDKGAGASAIDFLVKVEVVKSVLRTYVPHPYNPLKTLSHSYASAPNGQVTLSRSTILALSGWSNTQFSYWARRSEAISVLAPHDSRLRTVATALERRLQAAGLTEADAHPPSPSPSSSSHTAPLPDAAEAQDMEPEDWVRMYVTGKGLDVIIDDVKKRTGVSPFLRGKHSSLDPFGAASGEDAHGGGSSGASAKKAVVYMPTFQAEQYIHERPEADPSALAGLMAGTRAGKRKASTPLGGGSDTDESLSWAERASEVSAEDGTGSGLGSGSSNGNVKRSDSRPCSLSPPLLYPEESFAVPVDDARAPYFECPEPPRAVPAAVSTRGKKRRLIAPCPPVRVPGVPAVEPPRLYGNHLETG